MSEYDLLKGPLTEKHLGNSGPAMFAATKKKKPGQKKKGELPPTPTCHRPKKKAPAKKR